MPDAGRTRTGLLQFICQWLRANVKGLDARDFRNGLITGSGLVLDLNFWHFASLGFCRFPTLVVSQQDPEGLAAFDYSVDEDIARYVAFGVRLAVIGGFPIEDGVGEQWV